MELCEVLRNWMSSAQSWPCKPPGNTSGYRTCRTRRKKGPGMQRSYSSEDGRWQQWQLDKSRKNTANCEFWATGSNNSPTITPARIPSVWMDLESCIYVTLRMQKANYGLMQRGTDGLTRCCASRGLLSAMLLIHPLNGQANSSEPWREQHCQGYETLWRWCCATSRSHSSHWLWCSYRGSREHRCHQQSNPKQQARKTHGFLQAYKHSQNPFVLAASFLFNIGGAVCAVILVKSVILGFLLLNLVMKLGAFMTEPVQNLLALECNLVGLIFKTEQWKRVLDGNYWATERAPRPGVDGMPSLITRMNGYVVHRLLLHQTYIDVEVDSEYNPSLPNRPWLWVRRGREAWVGQTDMMPGLFWRHRRLISIVRWGKTFEDFNTNQAWNSMRSAFLSLPEVLTATTAGATYFILTHPANECSR